MSKKISIVILLLTLNFLSSYSQESYKETKYEKATELQEKKITNKHKIKKEISHQPKLKFSFGLSPAQIGVKWGFVDSTYSIRIKPMYDEVGDFQNGFARVIIGPFVGIIDTLGNIIVPIKYDYIWNFECQCDGLTRVRVKGKNGFINNKGIEVIETKYYAVGYVSEGLINVAIQDSGKSKWGFINLKGETVIPFKYDYAYDFRNGRASVELNGEYFSIDKNGNRINK